MDADGGLHRLLYRSSVAILGTMEQVEAGIAAILEVSRRRNAAEELTGVLLHAEGGFTQLLEGPLSAIERVYDRIGADLRHSALEILQFVPVQERNFGSWPMAYLRQEGMDAPYCNASPRVEVEAVLEMLSAALLRKSGA
jgi:hypothetical protein